MNRSEVRRIFRERGWLQKDIARQGGVSETFVSLWFKGAATSARFEHVLSGLLAHDGPPRRRRPLRHAP